MLEGVLALEFMIICIVDISKVFYSIESEFSNLKVV